MPTRYYLIPFETDEAKKEGMRFCPMYVTLLPLGSNGLQPKELTFGKWQVEYYVIRVPNQTNEFLDKLESQMPEALRIDKDIDINRLTVLGVDTTALSVSSSEADIQRACAKWTTDEDKDFTELLGK